MVFQVMRRYGIEEPYEKLKDVTRVLGLICREMASSCGLVTCICSYSQFRAFLVHFHSFITYSLLNEKDTMTRVLPFYM